MIRLWRGLLRRFGDDFVRVQRLVDPLVMALLYLGVALKAESAVPSHTHRLVAVIVLLLSLVVLGQARLYGSYRTQSLWVLLRRLSSGWLLVVLLLVLVGFLSKQTANVSRADTVLFAFVGWLDLVLVHVGGRKWLRRHRQAGGNSRRVLFWGRPDAAARFADALHDNAYLGLVLVDAVDAQAAGGLQQLEQLLQQGRGDRVVISEPLLEPAPLLALLSRHCLPLHYLPVWAEASMRFEVNRVGELILVDLWTPSDRSIALLLKRLADLLAGLLLLLVLLPLLLLIAAAVRLSSPGPVLFRQQRSGLDGRPFTILKFRTMRLQACGDAALVPQAQRHDPRVTAVGRLLRLWSLDELPQLWNVLRGQMSLVGPRPHAVVHDQLYSAQIQGYMQRHLLRPGLTGLAQVQGLRGATPQLSDMQKRIQADLTYQAQWSLLLDLKILLLTLLRCWRQPQAY